MASGITFFSVGVVFTLTMPDNIALGITFLGLGVVFFSLAGSQRAPGDGPGAPPADPAAADPAAAAPPPAPDVASPPSSPDVASPPEPPRA